MTLQTKYLKIKLIGAFILFCMLPVLVISIYNYIQLHQQIENSFQGKLNAIAQIKAEQIERYFDRAEINLETIVSLPAVENLLYNPKQFDKEKEENLQALILSFIAPRDIEEVYIYDQSKNLIFSVNYNPKSLEKISNDKLFAAKTNTISHIFKDQSFPDDYLFFMSDPIMNKNGNFKGTIIAKFTANPFFDLVQDRTGLGSTGETQLGQRIGNEIVFLNPLRLDPNAALMRKIRIGDKNGLPIQASITGKSGAGYTFDYLGHEVLASWRFIRTPQWGMVVKIDAKEVYGILDNYKISIGMNLAIILLFGIAASYMITLQLMRPIKVLDHSAHNDPLTGVPNRKFLIEELHKTIENTKLYPNIQTAVLFLDLDGFKEVNDQHGHKAGDWLLKMVAERLMNIIRSDDMVARFGGDEFIILLKNIKGSDDVNAVATKIIKELNEPFHYETSNIRIGVSIGASICHTDTCQDSETILLKADHAMYEAKQSGKNCFRFSD